MNMSFSIALEYISNRKRQALLSILGVMLGVAFFIAIAGMMRGMHDYFIEKLIDVVPHVKIMDEFRTPLSQPVYHYYPDALIDLRGIKPREELRGIRGAKKIISQLQKNKKIRVSPALQGQAFLRYGGKDLASTIIGIDPKMEHRTSNLARDMVSGSLNSLLTNSNGIILGESLADKLAVRMGSKLSVISPAGIIKKMKIVGLFDSGVPEVDSSTSYAMLKKVQILQNKEDVINQINIRMDDIDNAPALASNLERRYLYRTESWQESFANLFEIFMIENAIMYSTVGAILLVAGFGIFNIISTTVNEKKHDIAILKSIGFSEKDVRYIFLFQGIIVGVIGTLLGWLLGALLVELLSIIDLSFEDDKVQMPVEFEGFPMYRSIWLYIGGGMMAIVASSVSAYLPAKKAAAVYPVDIIRGAA
jgi:lipoprotein-releasing system permease protein